MNLHKIARKFAFKLAAELEASPGMRAKKVYDLGIELTNKNMVDMWVNSTDLTGGYEMIVTEPLQEIRKLVKQYHADISQYGLNKENNIKYITKLKAQIQELETVKLDKGLDPRARGLFGSFREAVYFVPEVAIPKQNIQRGPVNLPEQIINNEEENVGAGYSYQSTPDSAGPWGMRDLDRWNQ